MRESIAILFGGVGVLIIALFLLVMWSIYERPSLLIASGLLFITGACFTGIGLLSASRESQRNGL